MALKYLEAPARRASDWDCAPTGLHIPREPGEDPRAARRAVVKRDFTGETADLLISDIRRVLPAPGAARPGA